jgi:hypothetical protein
VPIGRLGLYLKTRLRRQVGSGQLKGEQLQ